MALVGAGNLGIQSTNRSTSTFTAVTGCQIQDVYRRQGLDHPGLRQAGNVVDLDYQPFFLDRVEDAVPPYRKEVMAMCECCGTSTCNGSCCDGACC